MTVRGTGNGLYSLEELQLPRGIVVVVRMKFPRIDFEGWILARKESLDDELSNYNGLFGHESVEMSFRDLMMEHLFLQESVDQMIDWRENFLAFLMNEIDTIKNERQHSKNNVEFLRGKLAALVDILRWL